MIFSIPPTCILKHEAEPGVFGVGSFILGVKVAGVVKQLRSYLGVIEIYLQAPQGSGCCRAVMVDMPLQHCMVMEDYAFGVADGCGGSPYQEGG